MTIKRKSINYKVITYNLFGETERKIRHQHNKIMNLSFEMFLSIIGSNIYSIKLNIYIINIKDI